eukprot:4879021-Prymnesium_polylepis.1
MAGWAATATLAAEAPVGCKEGMEGSRAEREGPMVLEVPTAVMVEVARTVGLAATLAATVVAMAVAATVAATVVGKVELQVALTAVEM